MLGMGPREPPEARAGPVALGPGAPVPHVEALAGWWSSSRSTASRGVGDSPEGHEPFGGSSRSTASSVQCRQRAARIRETVREGARAALRSALGSWSHGRPPAGGRSELDVPQTRSWPSSLLEPAFVGDDLRARQDARGAVRNFEGEGVACACERPASRQTSLSR